MAKTKCPYEKTIRDEASGIDIPNQKYVIWMDGFNACVREYTEEVKRIISNVEVEIKRLRQPVRNIN